MPIPDYQDLMVEILRLARDGPIAMTAMEDRIAKLHRMTPEERRTAHPGRRHGIFENRVHWSKYCLRKAGLVRFSTHKRLVITEQGLRLLERNRDDVNGETLVRYPIIATLAAPGAAGVPPGEDAETKAPSPRQQIEAGYRAYRAALQAELLERIYAEPPVFFERLIIALLVGMGYGSSRDATAKHLGRAGDEGVDGVISCDVLGLEQIYVQAKRFAPSQVIVRSDVQAFAGSLIGLGASRGVFVTTSDFTAGAVDYAKHVPQRIVLIDGATLAELMIEYDIGVRTVTHHVLKQVDETFFDERAV